MGICRYQVLFNGGSSLQSLLQTTSSANNTISLVPQIEVAISLSHSQERALRHPAPDYRRFCSFTRYGSLYHDLTNFGLISESIFARPQFPALEVTVSVKCWLGLILLAAFYVP